MATWGTCLLTCFTMEVLGNLGSPSVQGQSLLHFSYPLHDGTSSWKCPRYSEQAPFPGDLSDSIQIVRIFALPANDEDIAPASSTSLSIFILCLLMNIILFVRSHVGVIASHVTLQRFGSLYPAFSNVWWCQKPHRISPSLPNKDGGVISK